MQERKREKPRGLTMKTRSRRGLEEEASWKIERSGERSEAMGLGSSALRAGNGFNFELTGNEDAATATIPPPKET